MLHLGRNSSRQGWMPTKPDSISMRTDTLMGRLQTRRQGLKHDSLTSIVSTSDGSNGVAVELLRWMLAAWLAGCMRIWSRARAQSVNTKLLLKFK